MYLWQCILCSYACAYAYDFYNKTCVAPSPQSFIYVCNFHLSISPQYIPHDLYTNITLTCISLAPVYQPHLYITLSVYHYHLLTTLTCISSSPVYHPHLYITLTCISHSPVYHSHLYITSLKYHPHLNITLTYISPSLYITLTCISSSAVYHPHLYITLS